MLPDVVPPSRPVFIILILLSVESWTPCCTPRRLVPQSSLPVVMGNSLELQTQNCGNWCWEWEGGVMLREIGHWAGSMLKGAKFLAFHIFHTIPRKLCASFSFRPDWQILKTMVNHLFTLILNFQGKYLSIFWGRGAEFWGQNKSLPSELSALGRPHDVTVNGGTPNTLTAMGMSILSSEGLAWATPSFLPTLVSVWKNRQHNHDREHSQLPSPPLTDELWRPRAGSLLRPQLSCETGKWCFLHVNSASGG